MKQLQVEHLYFSYDDTFVLEDISFTLPVDQGCTLLIGRNGAGKSTLIHVVCDILKRDGGNVVKKGVRIAYLPFDSPFYPHLTILENLRYFYRSFQGRDFDMEEERVKRVLEAFEIDYIQQRFDKCSSGQQQKAGIVAMLLSNADLIIMDEPFVALDARSCNQLIAILCEMKKECAFLITIHNMQQLEHITDRILVLDQHHLQNNTTDKEEIHRYFHEGMTYDTI